jgi:catechol 2,3-dioxygenase-like lactoylglutathione lyase family enzyme
MLLIFNPAVTGLVGTAGRLPIPPHGATGPGHVCFPASVVEIEAWRERLIAKGVPIESDFEWPGGGRSLYFRDPAGNSLEFAEPRIWGLT